MVKTNIKVFCDLDGTLIDVSERHYRVYSQVISGYSGKILDKGAYWELKRAKTTWPELLKKSDVPIDKLHEFLDNFKQKIEDPSYLKIDTLFTGTIETLKFLSAKYSLVLVSLRRNPANLNDQVESLNIKQYFEAILTGHSESEGFDVKKELVKDKLSPGRDIIIGDTEADIITGTSLGLTTIAVLSGIRNQEIIEKLKPDRVVRKFSDVKNYL